MHWAVEGAAGLPRVPRKLVGRQDDICLVMNTLEDQQSVTIVGAGGVGPDAHIALAMEQQKKLGTGNVRQPHGVKFWMSAQ